MIPQLTAAPGISPLVADFITELHKAGFSGDTTTRYADRLTLATDNSIYQTLPAAVLFPRTTSDITFIARIADDQRFHALSFTPRGGGTGTNGQSLNHGVIVDMSRYMNHILEINPQEGWVRVEAGVVKDQLNAALKPYGYFFSPELSTSNRATLGGMINTDASGQGSMVYGKTSDHVLGLTVVLLGGTKLDTGPVPLAEAEQLAAEEGIVGKVYQAVLSACCNDRALVLEKFPDLNRFLTGYDLKHTVSEDLEHVDLTRLLCGSEGTLAFITEARLDITPLPKVRRLVNIKYDSFDSALRSAPLLVKAKALSVETVDSKVLNLAREDIIWHSVSSLITDVAGQEMLGLNIVEFAGDDESVIDGQVQTLCQQLEVLIAAQQGGVIGYQLCCDLQGIERIYAMRKKAVGLLGNAKGQAKPIPFVEDTCVPPQHVADYITEFRALLDGHGLNYGMFGHVDAGVLHVRPALDMCDPQQEILMKKISDEVVNLTARYGGLLWGEHGKGFRAEYSSAFFGEALFRHLRRIKAAFDPRNRLNPGKICTPLDCDEPMMTVDEIKRGSFDRRIPLTVRESWRGAMDCNGNGLCFNFDVYSPMCPSMKISANRLHSPKGRASLTREWLRLLAEQGVNPQQLEQALSTRNISWRAMLSRLTNSWRASRGEYDFSHEVKEAMSGCLACKACSTQCPIKIDVPAFRARFLQLYHTRYLRPVSDYLVASVESYTPIMAKAPGLVNFFLRQSLVKKLSQHTLGMVDLPLLSQPTLARRLKNQATAGVTLEQLEAMSAEQRQHCVLVVQDPFTTYYEAPLIDDLVKLITCLGYQPVILPFVPNGKAQHVKGFLRDFARTAAHSAEIFNRLSTLSLPMVGVDPALVLCYRDEYKEVLGEKRGTFCVQLVHEWLTEVLTIEQPVLAAEESWYLFGHCTETTALPLSSQQWQAIFSRYGARLENVSVGCCGMAGTYGHESKNLQNSRGIYALSWQKALEKLPRERCLATGYSCRSQVKRIENAGIRHPLQALLQIVIARSGSAQSVN